MVGIYFVLQYKVEQNFQDDMWKKVGRELHSFISTDSEQKIKQFVCIS